MKYWVFNEQQLKAALTAYAQELERKPGAFDPAGVFDAHSSAVKAFLNSKAARETKILAGTAPAEE